MAEDKKTVLLEKMADNLPVLRKKLNLTQEGLARMLDVSRSTLANVENRKRLLSWSTFLSIVLIFTRNSETDEMMRLFGIYTDELNEFLSGNSETA